MVSYGDLRAVGREGLIGSLPAVGYRFAAAVEDVEE